MKPTAAAVFSRIIQYYSYKRIINLLLFIKVIFHCFNFTLSAPLLISNSSIPLSIDCQKPPPFPNSLSRSIFFKLPNQSLGKGTHQTLTPFKIARGRRLSMRSSSPAVTFNCIFNQVIDDIKHACTSGNNNE